MGLIDYRYRPTTTTAHATWSPQWTVEDRWEFDRQYTYKFMTNQIWFDVWTDDHAIDSATIPKRKVDIDSDSLLNLLQEDV